MRLDGVTAYVLPAAQLEAGRGVILRLGFVLDHDICLTPAQRARTSAAQRLEIKIAFVPIIPRDGEDVVYDLDILRFHTALLKSLKALEPLKARTDFNN